MIELLVIVPCAFSALFLLLFAIADVIRSFRRPRVLHEADCRLSCRPRGGVESIVPVRNRGCM